MNSPVATALREAWKSIGATRGFSLVTAALTFVLGALLLALVGQAHQQNTLVADGFSAPERRTVTITSLDDVPVLGWGDCATLGSLRELESCWTSGRALEVRNPHLPFAAVSAREVAAEWATLPIDLVEGRLPGRAAEAVLDATSARVLGLGGPGGVVVDGHQREWSIVGTYRPTHPQAPQGVLASVAADGIGRPHSLSLVTRSVAGIEPASSHVLAVLAPPSPDNLRVNRPEELSALGGGLSAGVLKGGLVVVFSVFAVAWVVTAMMCLLMVRARAVEFGRRRALGASRGWLLAMVLLQGTLLTVPAALAGAGAGLAWNLLVHGVATPPSLVGWLIAWQVLGALTAQLPPAFAASLRDPVRVLRAP